MVQVPDAAVSPCRLAFFHGLLRAQVDRANGFVRMQLIFNGNASFGASRSRLAHPYIRSLSSLSFHCTPFIALHSIMTFGPSLVMVSAAFAV